MGLPVGQRVVVRPPPGSEVNQSVVNALRGSGFEVRGLGMARPGDGPTAGESAGPQLWMGERNILSYGSFPPALAVVAALLGAGATLGTAEGYLTGTLTYAALWIVGSAILALFIWWRYGRLFESEIVLAAVAPASGSPRPDGVPGRPGRAVRVSWRAGRVESLLQSGHRSFRQVLDCPPPLIGDLAAMIRATGGSPATSPAA